MQHASFKIVGVSPISFNGFIMEPKKDKELPDDFEKRTWRKRMTLSPTGEVVIPPMALKNCLTEIAKFLGMKVPGKRMATYTKHFQAGVLVTDPINLGVKADDVQGEWIMVPSDGVSGGGKRVPKCFPRIDRWEGEAHVLILDPVITPSTFETHLREAGKFIGLGRFRPNRNGFYGRFDIKDLSIVDDGGVTANIESEEEPTVAAD